MFVLYLLAKLALPFLSGPTDQLHSVVIEFK